MRIARNIQSMKVQTNINRANNKLSLVSNQLSTGLRLNSVKDDASGYAIATKLENQVRGLEKASTNSLDGVSMAQTLDGALSSMTEMIQRARELAVQASNDTNSQSDRQKMQEELDQIIAEIDTMQDTVNFNGKKLIGGDATRITYSKDTAGVEQSMTEINYVSNTVPEGTLKYTIDSPGTPANAQMSFTTGAGLVGTDGSFKINDIVVEYSKDDTYDEINSKTLEAFEMAGLSFENGYVFSNKEGSNEKINFEGDYLVAGITVGTFTDGTDAKLSDVKYVDNDGNDIDSFNDNMVVVIEGNNIAVTSTNSQRIELDINFVGMESDGSFRFGDENNPSKQYTSINGEYVSEITNYGGITIQTGESKGMDITVFVRELNSQTLGMDNVKITTQFSATNAIATFDKALGIVSSIRSEVGAYQNRFQSIVENLDVATINTQTSLSRIRDIDMAKAMIEYTTEEVKLNAGISVLQQANERPQSILQLM